MPRIIILAQDIEPEDHWSLCQSRSFCRQLTATAVRSRPRAALRSRWVPIWWIKRGEAVRQIEVEEPLLFTLSLFFLNLSDTLLPAPNTCLQRTSQRNFGADTQFRCHMRRGSNINR